jgi:hypothetical protein
MLAPAIIACKRCGNAFQPKRLAQHYCSKRCRQNSFHQRKRSVERGLPATTIPEKGRTDLERAPTTLTVRSDAPVTNGPTPGALQGDDYPLEYYEDGFPKLPACLDRRAVRGRPAGSAGFPDTATGAL